MTTKVRNQKNESESAQANPMHRGTSVNRVILVSRLLATPQLRVTATGTHVSTVRVATNDRVHAEFHDIVLGASSPTSLPAT